MSEEKNVYSFDLLNNKVNSKWYTLKNQKKKKKISKILVYHLEPCLNRRKTKKKDLHDLKSLNTDVPSVRFVLPVSRRLSLPPDTREQTGPLARLKLRRTWRGLSAQDVVARREGSSPPARVLTYEEGLTRGFRSLTGTYFSTSEDTVSTKNLKCMIKRRTLSFFTKKRKGKSFLCAYCPIKKIFRCRGDLWFDTENGDPLWQSGVLHETTILVLRNLKSKVVRWNVSSLFEV